MKNATPRGLKGLVEAFSTLRTSIYSFLTPGRLTYQTLAILLPASPSAAQKAKRSPPAPLAKSKVLFYWCFGFFLWFFDGFLMVC